MEFLDKWIYIPTSIRVLPPSLLQILEATRKGTEQIF
jgi:hypothetical protein